MADVTSQIVKVGHWLYAGEVAACAYVVRSNAALPEDPYLDEGEEPQADNARDSAGCFYDVEYRYLADGRAGVGSHGWALGHGSLEEAVRETTDLLGSMGISVSWAAS